MGWAGLGWVGLVGLGFGLSNPNEFAGSNKFAGSNSYEFAAQMHALRCASLGIPPPWALDTHRCRRRRRRQAPMPSRGHASGGGRWRGSRESGGVGRWATRGCSDRMSAGVRILANGRIDIDMRDGWADGPVDRCIGGCGGDGGKAEGRLRACVFADISCMMLGDWSVLCASVAAPHGSASSAALLSPLPPPGRFHYSTPWTSSSIDRQRGRVVSVGRPV